MEPEIPSNAPSRHAPRASIGAWALAAAGVVLAGVALSAAAAFSTVIKIRLNTVEVAHYTGMDRSSVALLVLAGFALVLVIGAIRGARPAMVAIGLVGIGILLVAILIDVPHLHDTGVWPQNDLYEDAQATPGIGFYMETAGGILLLLGGAAMLLLAVRPAKPERATRERATPEAVGGENDTRGRSDGPSVAAEPEPEPEPEPAAEAAEPRWASDELPELPESLPPEPSQAARFSDEQPGGKRRRGGLVDRFGLRKR